jgi:predicted porin
MGFGIFDNQASSNSCADQIGNIMAANIGVGFKVSDKLKLTADLWYATLAEDNAKGDDDLGTEIDLVLTYSLMKNLNLDVVAAYLFAGDATYKGANDKDAYEIGTQLSFRF